MQPYRAPHHVIQAITSEGLALHVGPHGAARDEVEPKASNTSTLPITPTTCLLRLLDIRLCQLHSETDTSYTALLSRQPMYNSTLSAIIKDLLQSRTVRIRSNRLTRSAAPCALESESVES